MEEDPEWPRVLIDDSPRERLILDSGLWDSTQRARQDRGTAIDSSKTSMLTIGPAKTARRELAKILGGNSQRCTSTTLSDDSDDKTRWRKMSWERVWGDNVRAC